MKSDYLVEVQLCIVGWTKVYADRNEVCRLGQSVNNHPNGVKNPLSSRESNNKIHTYLLPFPTWDREWLK
jgi:hypothetical protein